MSGEIVITTGARLHFGLLAHGQAGRRQFGGVGVMIDRPGFVLRAAAADADELHCGRWLERVVELLARLRAEGRAAAAPPPMRLEILEAPPAHAGLGSGTQLGMAVAKIASLLAGEDEVSEAELARRAGRGRRSAVGLHGFRYGGLLIEAGKGTPDEISPLVAHVNFPAEWRFVLVRPRGATGLAGAEEAGSFARLPPTPQPLTDHLCRLALTQILPASIAHNFDEASTAIAEFGRLVGEYFAPVQGGIFADVQMRRLAEKLELLKIRGVGQTSWGPTLFILCPDAAFAQKLAAELACDPCAADCEFTIASPMNRGATVEWK